MKSSKAVADTEICKCECGLEKPFDKKWQVVEPQPSTQPHVCCWELPDDPHRCSLCCTCNRRFVRRGERTAVPLPQAGDFLLNHPDYEKWPKDSPSLDGICFRWRTVVQLMKEFRDASRAPADSGAAERAARILKALWEAGYFACDDEKLEHATGLVAAIILEETGKKL